jgi:NAD(P)H-hydrate repair Nnr-like enzyme with NAD(P)H-hydrate epimerase domain
MATPLGKPAINDPRSNDLREVQIVIGNIRERFRTLDAAVSQIGQQQQAAGQTANSELDALRRQIATLQEALAALVLVVDAMDPGSIDTDPRTEQLAGELQQLRRDIAAIDIPAGAGGEGEPGQQPVHAALLQGLQEQIDDINRGVLV